MPFLFCDINNVCNYAQNNDDSIWLSTAEPMPMTMTPIAARDMERYISRCSVCESRTKMIALHSQSMTIPNCPETWEESWIGYSYLMVNLILETWKLLKMKLKNWFTAHVRYPRKSRSRFVVSRLMSWGIQSSTSDWMSWKRHLQLLRWSLVVLDVSYWRFRHVESTQAANSKGRSNQQS